MKVKVISQGLCMTATLYLLVFWFTCHEPHVLFQSVNRSLSHSLTQSINIRLMILVTTHHLSFSYDVEVRSSVKFHFYVVWLWNENDSLKFKMSVAPSLLLVFTMKLALFIWADVRHLSIKYYSFTRIFYYSHYGVHLSYFIFFVYLSFNLLFQY